MFNTPLLNNNLLLYKMHTSAINRILPTYKTAFHKIVCIRPFKANFPFPRLLFA